jgi:hypothetical protein
VERWWPTIARLHDIGATTGSIRFGPLRKPEDLHFIRVLDKDLRAQLGGLGQFNASITELRNLPLTPTTVIVCENLTNGRAFTDDIPGVVVVAGKGFAITRFADLPWVQTARTVLYWGDIDTHGYAILDRFRHHRKTARSILMDEGTLAAGRSFWVNEEPPTRATLTELTDGEQAVYEGLRKGQWATARIPNIRFEQERVPWAVALATVHEAIRQVN